MSDAVQIAIVQGIATAVPVLFGLWLAHRNVAGKMNKIGKEMDGMKDALVAGAGREGRAKGKIEGHAQGVADEKAKGKS